MLDSPVQSGEDIFGNVEVGSSTPLVMSSDVDSSKYHQFRSMAHDLADQNSQSCEEVKNWID